jgi:hypothetical protein
MTDRFIARSGEVWDQTTLPHHKLDLDDARLLVNTWAGRANECRRARDFNQARCWSEPADDLREAIAQAETQRRLDRPFGGRPLG